MANFCSNCGSGLSGGNFCPNCGAAAASRTMATGSKPATAGWWVTGGGDPGHTNFSSDHSLSPDSVGQMELQWTFPCERGVISQPVVVEERVFFGTPDGYGSESAEPAAALQCVDAKSGLLIWRNAATGLYNSNLGNLIGTPTYHEGWLYCQYEQGPLWAIDARTGDERSALYVSSSGQRGDEPPPTIAYGLLFHAEYSEIRIASIDEFHASIKKDILWINKQNVLDVGSNVLGAISVDQNVACAITDSGAWIGPANKAFSAAQFVGFPPEVTEASQMPDEDEESDDGDWNDISSTGACGALGYAVTRLAALNPYTGEAVSSSIVCFGLSSPRVMWSRTSSTLTYSDSALAHGRALFGDSAGTLRAVDLLTGSEVWVAKVGDGSPISFAPLVVNGLVFVGNSAGQLIALDAISGQPVWELRLPNPLTGTPAIAEGSLYVPTSGGLVAIF